jgi:hypothetical protein
VTSLGDAVAKMVGGDRPVGDWRTQRGELVAHHGSVAAAARAAGIPRRTWRYWTEREAAGKTPKPKPAALEALRGALWESRAIPEAEVRLETRDRADERPRIITNGNLDLSPGTMQRVARVFGTSGQEAAAQAFLAGIGVDFYQRYLAPRREEVRQDAVESLGEDDEEEEFTTAEYEATVSDYDTWYDDTAYEGYIGDGDTGTFSGGTVVGVG